MLNCPPRELTRPHRRQLQGAPRHGVAFQPPFDPAENVVEKNGLGTSPPTPQTPKECREKKQGKAESADAKKKQPSILRRESITEKMKTPLGYIDKDRGVTTHGNPGEQQINDNQPVSA